MKSLGKVKKPLAAGPAPAPLQLRAGSKPLFPTLGEEVPPFREAGGYAHRPPLGHNFGEVALTAPVAAGSSAFSRLKAGTCPLSLAGPRACPFGGACHTCPLPVQAKLAISRPDDPYEREADRVAEQVMRLSDDEVRPRGCSMCNSEENEVLRLKELPGQAHAATPQGGVHSFVLQVVRSQGQPLDRATREFMDSRFGYDFSQVKIHIDRKAALTAHKVNASAFTLGRDIVFAAGHYAPHTSEGKRLLAHELAHVIQQAESGEFYVQREELHLYDPSDNPLRRWGYAHHYCEDYNVFTGYCSRDKPGMLHAGIRDLEGVRTWINFFSDSYTLNAIYFHTHGAPGYVDLPDGGISTENVWDLNTVSEKIASNAKIGFFGCNVAEGQEGSDFLLNAGSSLLEVGGGIVYASDSITFSVPGIGQRRPIWSKIKVVCVDPGGDSRIC